jgi:hypothetical protein
MNCQECNGQLLALTENLLDDSEAQAIREHLADCPECQAERDATSNLQGRLIRFGESAPDADITQSVMDRITVRQIELVRSFSFSRRIQVLAAAAIAASVLIGLAWTVLYVGPAHATAAEVLANGVAAASKLKSIYIKCRMRTLPRDNFAYIDLKHDFVDVELWKQFQPLKWRIEKSGRVAAMDSQKTVMVIDDKYGVKLDVPAPEPFDTGWLQRLAAIKNMISSDLTAASLPSHSTTLKRIDDATDSSHETISVQIGMNAKVGDYLKNTFLDMSNTRREYTFDRETGRLEAAKWFCQDKGKEVLVLDIVEIKYDPTIEDSKFELNIPEDIAWGTEPQRLPDNEKYEKMTPADTTKAFFDACSKRDWDEAVKFFSPLNDLVKQNLGGLKVVKIGEPFQVWPYAGWFVPYEIQLSDGTVRKWNLAVRNDNPAKRYVVDGGI